MTAGEVIDEIKHLAPGEQARGISFVRGLDQAPRLTGRELTVLAGQLVQTTDPSEVEALKARIAAGFYGEGSHA